jgi:hypothetical protein
MSKSEERVIDVCNMELVLLAIRVCEHREI